MVRRTLSASFSESSMAAYPNRFNADWRDGRYLLRRCRREQRTLRRLSRPCDATTHENTVNVVARQDHFWTNSSSRYTQTPHRCSTLFGSRGTVNAALALRNKTRNLLEWPAGSGITKIALAHIMVDIIGLRRRAGSLRHARRHGPADPPRPIDIGIRRGTRSHPRPGLYTLALTRIPPMTAARAFPPHRQGGERHIDGLPRLRKADGCRDVSRVRLRGKSAPFDEGGGGGCTS